MKEETLTVDDKYRTDQSGELNIATQADAMLGRFFRRGNLVRDRLAHRERHHRAALQRVLSAIARAGGMAHARCYQNSTDWHHLELSVRPMGWRGGYPDLDRWLAEGVDDWTFKYGLADSYDIDHRVSDPVNEQLGTTAWHHQEMLHRAVLPRQQRTRNILQGALEASLLRGLGTNE